MRAADKEFVSVIFNANAYEGLLSWPTAVARGQPSKAERPPVLGRFQAYMRSRDEQGDG